MEFRLEEKILLMKWFYGGASFTTVADIYNKETSYHAVRCIIGHFEEIDCFAEKRIRSVVKRTVKKLPDAMFFKVYEDW